METNKPLPANEGSVVHDTVKDRVPDLYSEVNESEIDLLRQKYPDKSIAVLFFLALLSKYNISCFEKLLYEDLRNEISVLIVVNDATDKQYDLIYDLQLMVFETFPDVLIDFRLIDRFNNPLEEVTSGNGFMMSLS